jgi:hypothetical protein
VTIARSLTDTFAGIAPSGVIGFVAAQLIGTAAAVIVGKWLWVSDGVSHRDLCSASRSAPG